MTNTYLIEQKRWGIAATANQYPGVVIVYSYADNRGEYMSTQGLALLGTTLPELRSLSPSYYK